MQQSHQSRMQQLLLISKLLDGRDNASPFTLIIDSLEQAAKPLLRHYISRAKTSSTSTIFVAVETLRPPPESSHILYAHNLSLSDLRSQIVALSSTTLPKQRTLLVLDTLHFLFTDATINPATYLSSLTTPTTHLIGIWHASQPLTPSTHSNPYAPPPLSLLSHLSTTILTTHSLSHIIAAKAASSKARAPPPQGLAESEEGALLGLGANDVRGVVVECEMRRRSGRSVGVWFVLDPVASGAGATKGLGSGREKEKERDVVSFKGITLLEEHPLYRSSVELDAGAAPIGTLGDGDAHGGVSFSLGLTEKQRRDREGIVLPYTDAQGAGIAGEGEYAGAGEGGRILYDMGSEDDFDDEEDEI